MGRAFVFGMKDDGSIGLEAIVPNAGVAFASAANPTTAAVAPAPAMPTMSVKSFEA